MQAKSDQISEMLRKYDDTQRAFDQLRLDNERLNKHIHQLNKSLKVFLITGNLSYFFTGCTRFKGNARIKS